MSRAVLTTLLAALTVAAAPPARAQPPLGETHTQLGIATGKDVPFATGPIVEWTFGSIFSAQVGFGLGSAGMRYGGGARARAVLQPGFAISAGVGGSFGGYSDGWFTEVRRQYGSVTRVDVDVRIQFAVGEHAVVSVFSGVGTPVSTERCKYASGPFANEDSELDSIPSCDEPLGPVPFAGASFGVAL